MHPVKLALPLQPHELRQISLRERLALDELGREPRAVLARHELQTALHTSVHLAEDEGVGPELADGARAALACLDAPALDAAAIAAALDALDEQRRLATRGQTLLAVMAAMRSRKAT